jgi:replicative DNA helicase
MSILIEQNIIGALLIDFNYTMCRIVDKVTPEMFTDELYGEIYGRCYTSFKAGKDENLITLIKKSSSDRYPESYVTETLKSALDSTVSASNVSSVADTLVQEHRARLFMQMLNRINPDSNNIDKQILDFCADAQSLINDTDNEEMTLAEMAETYSKDYFKPRERPSINIGFRKLDESIGGIDGGDVVVIAARPKVGKSAFALQVGRGIARTGLKVGYFNLEMRAQQIYERSAAATSGMDMNRIRLATTFHNNEAELFKAGNEKLLEERNMTFHTGVSKVSSIRSAVNRKKYDCIIIDYLQLVRSDTNRGANRYAEVGDISRGIKRIAMDYDIPVILLSQLNRNSESRAEKEPTSADLRESGDIEQDASVILMLWKPDEEDQNKRMLKIDLARNGTPTREELEFDGRHMTFKEKGFTATTENIPFS